MLVLFFESLRTETGSDCEALFSEYICGYAGPYHKWLRRACAFVQLRHKWVFSLFKMINVSIVTAGYK